jgi:uncharacterized membrane protein
MNASRFAVAALASALALALAACSAAPQPPATPSPPAAPETPKTPATRSVGDVAATAPAIAPAWQRLRGSAIMGKDGYGVILCGETTQRIVQLDEPARAALDGFLANGAQQFRVDGWGDLPDPGHAHFAAFERFDVEGRICEDSVDGVNFRARGTEPFWSIDIGSSETTLERPDHAKLSGPTKSLGETHDIVSYEAATPEGRLLVRFSPAICHDGMSEAQFAWRADVTLGAQKWSGCGYRGGATLARIAP